nr:hypothetical protein [Brevundimonas diminuta]
MGFVLLIVAGLVAWLFISAAIKGKVRDAEAEQREVQRIMSGLKEAPSQKPTWAGSRDSLREFVHAVGRLGERRGIPLEFFQQLDESKISWLLHYLAILERRGASFTNQKIAAVDHLTTEWFALPMHHQVALTSAEIKRKIGG